MMNQKTRFDACAWDSRATRRARRVHHSAALEQLVDGYVGAASQFPFRTAVRAGSPQKGLRARRSRGYVLVELRETFLQSVTEAESVIAHGSRSGELRGTMIRIAADTPICSLIPRPAGGRRWRSDDISGRSAIPAFWRSQARMILRQSGVQSFGHCIAGNQHLPPTKVSLIALSSVAVYPALSVTLSSPRSCRIADRPPSAQMLPENFKGRRLNRSPVASVCTKSAATASNSLSCPSWIPLSSIDSRRDAAHRSEPLARTFPRRSPAAPRGQVRRATAPMLPHRHCPPRRDTLLAVRARTSLPTDIVR